jgi:RluA family pseudouridine synthase
MKSAPKIIFQDDDIVIVNKPHNYLSIPDRFTPTKPNLLSFLNKKFEKVFIVHRLDKETSGIICFALNEESHRNLSLQFEKRTTEKIYLALVTGSMHNESGVIDKPIAKHGVVSGKMIVASRGKPSVTHYKVAERFRNYTLLEMNIKTGRMHQIRVHLQSESYPLAVDSMYGGQNGFLLSKVKLRRYKSGKNGEEKPLMSRCTLHSFRLTLDHPTTKERVSFEAELPKDFSAVIKQLRKWGK